MRQTILLATMAVALAACQDRGITTVDDGDLMLARGQPVQMVTGGGSVVREDIAGTPREIYGFQAQVDAEGNAWGEAEVHFPSDDVKMHIDVQCLVIERNWAWMSGPVTRSDDPETPVGRVFVWRVQDNGEGQGFPPDRVSRFVHRPSDNYPPDICRRKWALATFPWDNGNLRILTPGTPNLADLVGTWDATVLYFLNPGNPADTADLFASDGRFRWTIAPNGRFSQIWWRPGDIFENVTGVVDVVNGHLVMWTDESPAPTPIDCADIHVSGSIMGSRCSVPAGHDWDGDGEEDPSVVVSELRRKRTGILINDLAGVWDAVVWRYTSTADPTVTLDVLADGIHSVSVTVSLDSRLFVVIQPEGWTSQITTVLIDGNQMLARDGSESESFVFTLERGTWSFSVPQEVDFDHNGTQDPAILEAVLVRR